MIKKETDERGSVDIVVLLQRGWLIDQLLGVVGRENESKRDGVGLSLLCVMA